LQSGHRSRINALFYSPDGNTLGSFADGEGIKLWDTRSRELKSTLKVPDVRRAPFFKQGGKPVLVTVQMESFVQEWDQDDYSDESPTGRMKPSRTLAGEHTNVVFAGDGSIMAGYGSDGRIKIWDAQTGALLRAITGDRFQDPYASGLYLSPDGKLLAGAGAGGNSTHTIKLWDVETGKLLRTFTAPNGADGPVVFSPDGTLLAASANQSAYDQVVKLFDTRSGKLLNVLKRPQQTSSYAPLRFLSDSKRLICSGASLDLWNLTTGTVTYSLKHQGMGPTLSPDGRTVATVTGSDKGYSVQLYDVDTGTLRRNFAIGTGLLTALAFAPDEQTLAISRVKWLPGRGDRQLYPIQVWDTRTGRQLADLSLPTRSYGVGLLAFSPDGSTLAGRYDDKSVRLWDLTTGRLKGMAKVGTEYLSLAFTTGNKSVVGVVPKPLPAQWRHSEHNVLASPDGKYLAIATRSIMDDDPIETLGLWSIATKKFVWKRPVGRGIYINSMNFSPDGTLLAVPIPTADTYGATGHESFQLWDVRTGKVRHILDQHLYGSVVFSADGQIIAGASLDNVRVWDVRTGKPKRTFNGTGIYARGIALSPHGERLATGNYAGDIVLWDVATGKRIVTWIALPPAQDSLAEEWLCYTSDGYFDGSSDIARYIRWRAGEELLPAAAFEKQFRRPELVQRDLQGKK
jgi:WD40 repeat protein